MQKVNLLYFGIAMLIAYARAATMSCRADPGGNKENTVDDSSTFTLTCDIAGGNNNNNNNQDHIKSCAWEHYETTNENRGNSYEPDIACNYAEGSNGGSNCQSDSRITGTASKTSCQITISNSEPEDTGDWSVDVFTVSTFESVYFLQPYIA